MGTRKNKYEFIPGRNEQLETTIVLQKENRSVIHGVVVDENECPIENAVVKLFELPNKDKCCEMIPITHTFTDECGQFLFGPLLPGKRYIVKVWHHSVVIKHVPAHPFECNNSSSGDDHDHNHCDNEDHECYEPGNND